MIDAEENLQNYIPGRNHIKHTLKVPFTTITLLYRSKKATELCIDEHGTFVGSFYLCFCCFCVYFMVISHVTDTN